MENKHDADKVDDVMLPGFRFHPTDEELVGFYLKRKVQQRQLPIELIKQADIYKYDPWDLPKLASSGEKEWYFYCPRDRKYRNSARPNRVTGAGFWKATGTDRPIYSSDGGTKCIGLKKSLVFYRGRAAKGIKTDWMMHEFRLPSLSDPTTVLPTKKFSDKSYPANDAWAICRIFKKTNSMAQRAISQSWVSPYPETTTSTRQEFQNQLYNCPQFSSDNISCATEIGSIVPLCNNNTTNFSPLDILFHKSFINHNNSNGQQLSNSFISAVDATSSSMLLNLQQQAVVGEGLDDFSISMVQEMQVNGEDELRKKQSENSMWGSPKSIGFPFNLPSNEWQIDDLSWESGSPSCPSDISASYSTNKCYT